MSNNVGSNLVELLQANNLASNATADCDYLNNAVQSWLRGSATERTRYDFYGEDRGVFVLWAQLLPIRCEWQTQYPFEASDGVITHCRHALENREPCQLWKEYSPSSPEAATPEYFADQMGTRSGGILDIGLTQSALAFFGGSLANETFSVRVILNENSTLSFT